MLSEALQNATLLKKIDSLAFDQLFLAFNFNHFGCEVSIKKNTATPSKIQEKLAQYKLFRDIAL